MANLTPKTLYIGSDNAMNVYTLSNNAGSYAIVKNINICNTGESTLLCNLHLIPAGGSAGANNKVLSNFSVSSGETISYDSALVINAGASIYVNSSIATSTFTISGVEYIA